MKLYNPLLLWWPVIYVFMCVRNLKLKKVDIVPQEASLWAYCKIFFVMYVFCDKFWGYLLHDNPAKKTCFWWDTESERLPCSPCFAQIHSGIEWLTRRKIWKEFPGVGTTVVLVKPSVVRIGLVCGDWGLSGKTVLFFTYWLCWKSRDEPDISGIASCKRLCQWD